MPRTENRKKSRIETKKTHYNGHIDEKDTPHLGTEKKKTAHTQNDTVGQASRDLLIFHQALMLFDKCVVHLTCLLLLFDRFVVVLLPGLLDSLPHISGWVVV